MKKRTTLGMPFGVDNECYTKPLDPEAYTRTLRRIYKYHGSDLCLFAAAPDVVADAPATLARFEHWGPLIHYIGLPVALVAQDGLEDLAVPWDWFECLFIGGSTAWKLGTAAAALMHEARYRGKWVHVGRVNSWKRVDVLKVKPDSIDGTHWIKKPTIYLRDWQRRFNERKQQIPFPFYKEVPLWSPSS
jgi:hypothetical protein